MTGPTVRILPKASWPAEVVPGLSYVVTVDLDVESGGWPYQREEVQVCCTLDGSPGLTVETLGDPTLVLHRFGGTYGPARFLLRILDVPAGTGAALKLTLFTAGGVQFHSVPLPVARGDLDRQRPQAEDQESESAAASHRYSVERLPPRDPLPDPRWPSRLLAAANEVVPFVLRDAELAELRAWARAPRGLLGRLLHGQAGQGKTRLVTEFAHESAEDGWTVLMARPRPEEHNDDTSAAAAGSAADTDPLLMIVDYSERWEVHDILDLFTNLEARRGRTRVLLQARTADLWWNVVADELTGRGIAVEAMALAPLADDAANRRQIYAAAVTRFSELYGFEAPLSLTRPPDRLSEDPAFQQVLMIHMAALMRIDAAFRGAAEPDTSPAELSVALLERERQVWDRLRRTGEIVISPELMSRALYCAALTGPVPSADAVAVLDSTRSAPNATQQDVIRDHAHCYPPVDPRTVLEPLTPDRLSEDLLAVMITGNPAFAADPWALRAVRLLLDQHPRHARAAIGIMVEVARRWPAARTVLTAMLADRPEWAIAAGGSVLMALLTLPDIDRGLLESLESALPVEHHLSLDQAAVTITQRLLASGRQSMADQAGLYDRLGLRLSNLGQHMAALQAAQRAVELSRDLAAIDSASYQHALAESIDNLSNRLGELGQLEDGLVASNEAIAAYRTLAGANPERFRRPLAIALNNRSVRLGELGALDEALAAIDEAVSIYRTLAQEQPESFLEDLAKGLCNLSVQLADTGQPEPALNTIAEAVGIYRRLAAISPDTVAPDLATSLSNYSNRLGEAGLLAEALQAAAESVELQRTLAEQRPEVFQPSLALSLNNLANRLGDLGRVEQALAAIIEAVTINRWLSEKHRSRCLPDLALGLNNLSVRLRNLGEDEESLTVMSEALDIYRQLARARREVYLPELALSLNNYSNRLRDIRRFDEAYAAIMEAIEYRREMVERRPAAYLPDLAVSLSNAAMLLADSGRLTLSVMMAAEALEIRRRLASEKPEIYLPELGAALNFLASLLYRHGDREQAQELLDEVLSIDEGLPPGELRTEYEQNLLISRWIRDA